jgi:hypothetical protein
LYTLKIAKNFFLVKKGASLGNVLVWKELLHH